MWKYLKSWYTTTPTLPLFDVTCIDPKASNILIIGKRGTGKSTLVHDLLRHFTELSPKLIVDPLDELTASYTSAHQSVHTDPDVVKRVHPDTYPLMVLDNVSVHWKYLKSSLPRLFSKNLNIVTVQCSLEMPAELRAQFDYIFVLKELFHVERRTLYECFGSVIPSFDDFNTLLCKYTREYGCLVIVNAPQWKGPMKSHLFHYKAAV